MDEEDGKAVNRELMMIPNNSLHQKRKNKLSKIIFGTDFMSNVLNL